MGLFSAIKSLFGLSSKKTLGPGDRMLSCEDCNSEFVFDVGEQKFFKEKGFTDPKRCPRCRKKVRFRMRRRGRGQNHGGNNHQAQGNNQNHSQNHRNDNHHGRRGRHFSRRHSVIDGDSPYADER